MKHFKRIIALLCMISLMVPTYSFGVYADTPQEGTITGTVATHIYFGSYPQTEVVSAANQSGVYGKDWATIDDYIVNSTLYASLQDESGWENSDKIIDGAKYHRMIKAGATYSEKGSSSYYRWSDSTTYHYFKYEPIKWRILEKDGDDAFLLADIALDDQKYNSTYKSVTWETCTLRSWLNNEFISRAFTADEQDAINTTNVVNKDNIESGTNGGNNTQDKVFLLSEEEVYTDNAIKYGFVSSYKSKDKARQAKSSTYAKAMGTYPSTSSSYLGNCDWWLRSPDSKINYGAAYVSLYGDVDRDGTGVYNTYNFGLRPALHLNLKSSNHFTYETKEVTINSSDVTLSNTSYTYDGTAKEPEVSMSGIPYGSCDVAYVNNINPGKAKVIITGKGTLSGSITKTFDINLPAQEGSLTRDVYNLVEFGSYPQREVVYEEQASGVYGKSWATTDDYIVNSDLYSKLMSAEWDANGDATIDGAKYHRIKKGDATYSTSNSSYYNWSDSTTYHYFKYEPIKWRILEKDDDDAFLLADIALDNKRYNGTYTSVTWKTCTLRNWLNSEFINRAFTTDEQDAIKITDVVNNDNLHYGTNGGNNTQDKVFLLSEEEVFTDNAMKYGFDSSSSSYGKADKARMAKSSTYAKARGAFSNLGDCYWWLRSPGGNSYCAACVVYDGDVNRSGGSVTDDYRSAVRPALHINLKSIKPKDVGKTDFLKTISITKVDIPQDVFVYRNKAITPKVECGLREGVDYEVSYENNNKAGLAKIDLTGKGDWSGTLTKYFAIAESVDISDMEITLDESSNYYTGKPVCPAVSIHGLTQDVDYTVSYTNNDKVGVGTVTVSGKDGYTGSIKKNFLINQCEHSWKHHNAKPATCTESGWDAYDECTICGATTEHNTYEPLGGEHTWDDGVITTQPTGTTEGVKTYTCTKCGDTKVEAVEAGFYYDANVGKNKYIHLYSPYDDTIASIQSQDDSMAFGMVTNTSITISSGIEYDKTITIYPLKAGKVKLIVRNANGQITGYINLTIKENEDIYTGHIGQGKTVAIFSRNDESFSSNCDNVSVEQISKVFTYGLNIYTYTLNVEFNKAGKYTADIIGTKTGKVYSFSANVEDHDWSSEYTIDKAATCTQAGSKSIHCTKCDATKNATAINPLGHILIHHDGKAATCTEEGWKAYDTCSRCDYTTYEAIPALDHNFTNYVSNHDATCTEDGTKTAVCERDGCNETDTVADVNSKLGHSFTDVWKYDQANHWKACVHDGCLEIDSLSAHSFGLWVETKAPTCTDAGEKQRTCECGYVETMSVKELGHSFTNYVSNQDATCTEDGTKTAVCDREGCTVTDTVTDIDSKTGHSTALTYVKAKAATTKAAGNKAYYICPDCKCLFLDKACTKPTTKEKVTIAKLISKTQKITNKSVATYKASTLKKKAKTFSLGAKADGKGKLTYKVTVGKSKYITVSKTGKVTLKKGCKKGTYKIKISAAALTSGKYYYKATSKTVSIKVK